MSKVEQAIREVLKLTKEKDRFVKRKTTQEGEVFGLPLAGNYMVDNRFNKIHQILKPVMIRAYHKDEYVFFVLHSNPNKTKATDLLKLTGKKK